MNYLIIQYHSLNTHVSCHFFSFFGSFTCDKDPRNYFGHDLISEINNRLFKSVLNLNVKNPVDIPLSFPVMALLACNHNDIGVFLENRWKFLAALTVKHYNEGVSFTKDRYLYESAAK